MKLPTLIALVAGLFLAAAPGAWAQDKDKKDDKKEEKKKDDKKDEKKDEKKDIDIDKVLAEIKRLLEESDPSITVTEFSPSPLAHKTSFH